MELVSKTKLWKTIIIALGCIAIVSLVAVIIIRAENPIEKKIEQQLELADKYIAELDYEEAIIAYQEAINIEPKCIEAYLGLADIYVIMEDYEEAINILEQGYAVTGKDLLIRRKEEIERLIKLIDESDIEDEIETIIDEVSKAENKTEIIYYHENEKTRDMEIVSDEVIETLEKVPNSSVTYVAVGGYGNPCGMGVHFQNYAVGVRANPIDGYRYVHSESDTIEFYEYVYNEYLEYEVPWFNVPESGNHIIYVYYEKIE